MTDSLRLGAITLHYVLKGQICICDLDKKISNVNIIIAN